MKAYKTLVNRALAAGFVVSVFDGECWQVRQGTEAAAIVAAIESVDEAELIIRDPRALNDKGRAARVGWARVTCDAGMNDDESIIDCTANQIMAVLTA